MKLIRLYLCLLGYCGSSAVGAASYKSMGIDQLVVLPLEELVAVQVLSSTKTARRMNDAPSTVTVYDAEDINRMGFRTLEDILSTVPGVQTVLRENNRPTAWFRGAQSRFQEKTALFIDGVPYRDVYGGFSIDWQLPLSTVKRVEIIRGPGSAIYGQNAFAGIINIFTYAPGEMEDDFIETAVGNMGQRVLSFRSAHLAESAKLQAEGNFYFSDGQGPFADRQGRFNPQRREQDSENLSLKVGLFDDRLQLQASQRHFNNLSLRKGETIYSPREFDTTQFSARYQQALATPGANLQYHYYYSRQERFERMLKLSVNQEEDYLNQVSQQGLGVLFTYPFSRADEWVLGAEWQRESLDAAELNLIDHNSGVRDSRSFVTVPRYDGFAMDNYAVYAQGSHHFANAKTTLTVGGRADFLDLFDSQWSYRLGLVHHFSDKIFAKVLLGNAFRASTFNEFVYPRPQNDTPPQPEHITTTELQLGYAYDGSYHTLTVFNTDYRNYLDVVLDADNVPGWWDQADPYWFHEFGDVGRYRMRGLELESHVYFSHDFDVFCNLAYLDTRERETGTAIPLLADWTLAGGAAWRPRGAHGRWLLSAYFSASDERRDWPESQVGALRDAAYGDRREDSFTGAFMVWNAKFGYQFQRGDWRGLSLALEVKNLFNREYYSQSPVSYNVRYDQAGNPRDFLPRYDIQHDERSVLFSLAYHW